MLAPLSPAKPALSVTSQPLAYTLQQRRFSALDHITFGRQNTSPSEEAIQAEIKKLKASSTPFYKRVLLKAWGLIKLPFKLVFGLFFKKTSIMPNIPGVFKSLFNRKAAKEQTRNRALYNLTQDGRHLNPYLPYRASIQDNPKKLQQYEQLVKRFLGKIKLFQTSTTTKGMQDKFFYGKIINNPEAFEAFYQDFLTIGKGDETKSKKGAKSKQIADTPTKRFLAKALWHTMFRIIMVLTSLGWSPKKEEDDKAKDAKKKKDNSVFGKAMEHIIKRMRVEELADNREPVKDLSTKYMIAASIVEAFHNRPELIDKVVNKKEKSTFVLSSNDVSPIGGFCLTPKNLIVIKPNALWGMDLDLKESVSLHEFVHAVSIKGKEAQGIFDEMTAAQRKKYTAARDELFEMYNTQERTFLGRLRKWLTGWKATGIRSYAFHCEEEFITVTTDYFSKNAKALCQTDAGKRVYEVYRDFFRYDPLNDYKDLRQKTAA